MTHFWVTAQQSKPNAYYLGLPIKSICGIVFTVEEWQKSWDKDEPRCSACKILAALRAY